MVVTVTNHISTDGGVAALGCGPNYLTLYIRLLSSCWSGNAYASQPDCIYYPGAIGGLLAKQNTAAWACKVAGLKGQADDQHRCDPVLC